MAIKGLFSIFEAIFSTFCKFTAQNKCAYQIQHTKIFKIANFQPILNFVLCCVILTGKLSTLGTSSEKESFSDCYLRERWRAKEDEEDLGGHCFTISLKPRESLMFSE